MDISGSISMPPTIAIVVTSAPQAGRAICIWKERWASNWHPEDVESFTKDNFGVWRGQRGHSTWNALVQIVV